MLTFAWEVQTISANFIQHYVWVIYAIAIWWSLISCSGNSFAIVNPDKDILVMTRYITFVVWELYLRVQSQHLIQILLVLNLPNAMCPGIMRQENIWNLLYDLCFFDWKYFYDIYWSLWCCQQKWLYYYLFCWYRFSVSSSSTHNFLSFIYIMILWPSVYGSSWFFMRY